MSIYALPRSSWIKNRKFNYPCVPVLSSNCDQLKDILVKSCTLQKAKLTLTCIKRVAGRRTTASYMRYLLNFLPYTADLMQASKVFYPGVAPGVEGADVLERVTSLDLTVCCLLFVRCGA